MNLEHFVSFGKVYFSVDWTPIPPTELFGLKWSTGNALMLRKVEESAVPVDDCPLETWAIYRRTWLLKWEFVRFFPDTAFGFLPEDITDVLISLSEMDKNRRYRAIPLGNLSSLETRVKTHISFAGISKEIIVVPT